MDFASFMRTLPPRAIIRATGNVTFLKNLLAIAGDQVRSRKAAPGEDQNIIRELRNRLEHDPDCRPVIITGRLKPARLYDRDNAPHAQVVGEFEDVGYVDFREHRPGHTTLRIIGGKVIAVVV